MASKYAQAWAILKETKSLTLTLTNPRVERTIRKAMVEHKKLDQTRNLLERIHVTREISGDNLLLHFKLKPYIRQRDDFYDFTESDPSDII